MPSPALTGISPSRTRPCGPTPFLAPPPSPSLQSSYGPRAPGRRVGAGAPIVIMVNHDDEGGKSEDGVQQPLVRLMEWPGGGGAIRYLRATNRVVRRPRVRAQVRIRRLRVHQCINCDAAVLATPRIFANHAQADGLLRMWWAMGH